MANFILTLKGRQIDFGDPQPNQIDIDDVTRALSRLPRFSGHTKKFYSVAQHSVGVMLIVRDLFGSDLSPYGLAQASLEALLHDAHEAYTGDAPTPFKRAVDERAMMADDAAGPAFTFVQHDLDKAVRLHFGLAPSEPSCIKHADRIALLIEATSPNLGKDVDTWAAGLFTEEHRNDIHSLSEKTLGYITVPRIGSRAGREFRSWFNRLVLERFKGAEVAASEASRQFSTLGAVAGTRRSS